MKALQISQYSSYNGVYVHYVRFSFRGSWIAHTISVHHSNRWIGNFDCNSVMIQLQLYSIRKQVCKKVPYFFRLRTTHFLRLVVVLCLKVRQVADSVWELEIQVVILILLLLFDYFHAQLHKIDWEIFLILIFTKTK